MIEPIYKIIESMKAQRLLSTDLAGIQYIGLDGITSSCLKAMACLISSGEQIKKAFLLTHDSSHGFLLTTEMGEVIAVKSGFSSGYAGEGPRGLATALKLLDRHKVEIEEYEVDLLLMDRLGCSSLLQRDINQLEQQRPVRPLRWHDYMYEQGEKRATKEISRQYPLSIPFALIEERIIDLAVNFYENEDASIISAYRRLEDILRKRTGFPGEGTKLFSKAFLADDCPLRWDVPDDGEQKGRGNLFNAIYMAFRNARVHRESERDLGSELREFLLINELYRLESEAFTESELIAKRKEEAIFQETLRSLKSENDSEEV